MSMQQASVKSSSRANALITFVDGRFSLAGKPLGCDCALHAYCNGTKATKAARQVLDAWKRESEREAKLNERRWAEFGAHLNR